MKKGQRQPYLELANIVDLGLCNFCKYAEWSGGSCCESDLDCHHSLADMWRFPEPDDVWQGGDCWGFRPGRSLQQVGVVVGIMLEGNIPHKSKRYGEYVAIIPSENDKRELMMV